MQKSPQVKGRFGVTGCIRKRAQELGRRETVPPDQPLATFSAPRSLPGSREDSGSCALCLLPPAQQARQESPCLADLFGSFDCQGVGGQQAWCPQAAFCHRKPGGSRQTSPVLLLDPQKRWSPAVGLRRAFGFAPCPAPLGEVCREASRAQEGPAGASGVAAATWCGASLRL